MTVITDERLVHEALQGSIEAFEELIERYQRLVFTIAYRMTGHREEAEDISQEVFITLYRKLYQFDTSRKFPPWLQRITVNTCITHLRKKNKVVMLNFDETWSNRNQLFPTANYEDPAVVYDQKELMAEIWDAVRQMPENYRAMIVLRYQLELTNQEIADTLGISRENVEVRMHRARKSLRKILLHRQEERRKQDELSASR